MSPVDWKTTYDAVVIGGGNAALCGAMSAAEAGARVAMLEAAPRHFRGGNSRHTRNLRYPHGAATDFLTDAYPEEEIWEDLLHVTGGKTDESLAKLAIHESLDVGRWMEAHGCRFQPALRGTLQLSRTNAFFLGGGKALVNAYYDTAERLGVDIEYECEARELTLEDGRFASVEVRIGETEERRSLHGKSIILGSGGFEANLEWLKEFWGEAAERFIVRGTPFNQGHMFRELLKHGAQTVAEPQQCHAVAIDARAPKYDGGIVTRLDCVPFGIVVNKHAERFYDEGEEFWPKRYAIWGRLVAQQPDQIAYSIIDSKSIDLFMPSVFPPIEAKSLAELAAKLELDAPAFEKTFEEFNAAVRPGSFDHTTKDDCTTEGLTPPKTHWARTIDRPPYYAYPLGPGITFTYYGLKVNDKAQVVYESNRPAENIFAAGEIMAGNILGKGYLAGFGLTIGTVFGRIAGKEAAAYAIR